MSLNRFLKISVSATAVLTAGAASADVTAMDVWAKLKEQVGSAAEITVGSESMSGNTLTLSDIVFAASDAETTATVDLGELILTENGDGTVTMDPADLITVTVSQIGSEDADRVVVLIASTGATTVISGTLDEMAYQSRADRYTFTIDEVLEDGVEVPVDLLINLNNFVADQTMMTGPETLSGEFSFTADSLDMLLGGDDDGVIFNLSSQIGNLMGGGRVTAPAGDTSKMSEAEIIERTVLDFNYSAGTSATVLSSIEEGLETLITTSAELTNFTFSFDKDHIGIGGGAGNYKFALSGGEVPFPLDAQLSLLGYEFRMPISKTEEPAPFTAAINLTDLAPNDMIWMMADPMGAMPHDPVTAQIDISGTMTLFEDLATLSDENSGMVEMDTPAEVNSVTLNNLFISALGATLSGTGSFELDNTDLTTFAGMPRPMGSLNLEGKGLNGLIDRLSAMGMIPEEQLTGARFMMGMFATVIGDDHLSSTVEVNAEGHVIINGQRIQ